MIDCLDLLILLLSGFCIFNGVNYKAIFFMIEFRMHRIQLRLLRTEGIIL